MADDQSIKSGFENHSNNVQLQTYNLFPHDILVDGYIESHTLAGQNSMGQSIEMIYTIQTQKIRKTKNGKPTISFTCNHSLMYPDTNLLIPASKVFQCLWLENQIEILTIYNVIEAKSVSPVFKAIIPMKANIGYSERIGEFIDYSDNSRLLQVWTLQKTRQLDRAQLVKTTTHKDHNSKLIALEEESSVIDIDGKRKSLSFRIHYPDSNLTFHLDSQ